MYEVYDNMNTPNEWYHLANSKIVHVLFPHSPPILNAKKTEDQTNGYIAQFVFDVSFVLQESIDLTIDMGKRYPMRYNTIDPRIKKLLKKIRIGICFGCQDFM